MMSLNPAFPVTRVSQSAPPKKRLDATQMGGVESPWRHHGDLLNQALELVARLQSAAPEGYAYSHRIGPHLRHILEHYTALIGALDEASEFGRPCIDYDARVRDRMIETDPAAGRALVHALQTMFAGGEDALSQDAGTLMTGRFMTGPGGQTTVMVTTSLGRELLFLESHTVHHLALMAEYARGHGVDMGPNFGKAPATVAFETRQTAMGR